MTVHVRRVLAVSTGMCLVLAGAVAVLAAEKHKEKMRCEGHEQAVTVEQVPQAARDALTKLAGTATIAKYEKEEREGATLYEADWKVDGREQGATVTADGTLVSQEEGVAVDAVPVAVKDAGAKLLPAATNLKYEKETFVMYKIEGTVGGKEEKVMVMPTGMEHWKVKKGAEKPARAERKHETK
jgi:hypothetical protein